MRILHPRHDFPDGDFLLRLVADGVQIVCGEVVARLIFLHLVVDFSLGDGVHHLDQMADRPVVHLPAELHLGLDLVALRDRHVAHVVAEADDAELAGEGRANRRAHPGAQLRAHRRVLPEADQDLARNTQPRADVAVFPVAVRGLVEIHEVHVDLFVGDMAVVLRGKVAPGLLQKLQAVDPHFGRRKRVAPGDDAGAAVVRVGLLHDRRAFGLGLDRHLVDDRERDLRRLTQLLRHLLRARLYGFQHLRPIQELRADNKPEFIIFHRRFSSIH